MGALYQQQPPTAVINSSGRSAANWRPSLEGYYHLLIGTGELKIAGSGSLVLWMFFPTSALTLKCRIVGTCAALYHCVGLQTGVAGWTDWSPIINTDWDESSVGGFGPKIKRLALRRLHRYYAIVGGVWF